MSSIVTLDLPSASSDAAEPAPLQSRNRNVPEIRCILPAHARRESLRNAIRVGKSIAFPDSDDGPAGGSQLIIDFLVARHVAPNLRHPPVGPVWKLRLKAWQSPH